MNDSKPTAILDLKDQQATLALAGSWLDYAQTPEWETLAEQLTDHIQLLNVTDAGIKDWNSTIVAFVLNLVHDAKLKHIQCQWNNLPKGIVKLLDLALAVPERQQLENDDATSNILAKLGRVTVDATTKTGRVLDFLGEITRAIFRFLQGRTRTKWRDIFFQIARCGHQAIAIVSLMSFLIGVILAFIGSIPLGMFGADVYVATLVGIGVQRLMSATTVGTVMAGRTGAAYAAELGSMQANEEVDAYIAMGISPVEMLVLPRTFALSFTMPLLCIYSDALGILGGMAVGVFYSGISFHTFLQHMQETTELQHFFIGVFTCWVFGCLISLCGCYHGMKCGRNSTAVGQAATAAVVSSIVCMVIATAIITLTTVIIGI